MVIIVSCKTKSVKLVVKFAMFRTEYPGLDEMQPEHSNNSVVTFDCWMSTGNE